MKVSGRIILIAPLDWGLGHSTRCIPLIRTLAAGNRVIIGVTHVNRHLFALHFPDAQLIEIPSYRVSYCRLIPAWLCLLLRSGSMLATMWREHAAAEKLLQATGADLVISDNRPGFRSTKVHSVYITHQLRVPLYFFSGTATRLHRKLMRYFNEVWIPDHVDATRRLAGALSEPGDLNLPVKFLGPLSVLSLPEILPEKKFDVLFLLSGVEPQRSILEEKLLKATADMRIKCLLIRGSREGASLKARPNLEVTDFCTGEELSGKILQADLVICRSGYSTLMDLNALNVKNILLVPTPGQPEQEYLANWWKTKFGAQVLKQKEISEASLRTHLLPAR